MRADLRGASHRIDRPSESLICAISGAPSETIHQITYFRAHESDGAVVHCRELS